MFSFLLLLAAMAVFTANAFVPTKLSIGEIQAQSELAKESLLKGLEDVGLVTITEIPNFSQLRKEVLELSASCLQSEADSSLQMEFPDGTRRYTMGAASGEDLSGVNFKSSECLAFKSAQAEFRNTVNTVTEHIVSLLDESLGLTDGSTRLLMDTEDLSVSSSVSEIVNSGLHLEHFHLYEKESTLQDLYINDFSRKLHTDHGLFIVLTPALTLNADSGVDHGFFIQLKNGEIVQPDFGTEKAELVFMIGDGFKQWLSPKLGVELRATPHAVVMPYTNEAQSVRSWYGRMIMPKSSMYLEPQKQTFGELRALMMSLDKSDKEAVKHNACSSGMMLGERLLQSCPEGQIACWTGCLPVNCEEGFDEKCGVESSGGFQECPPDQHNCEALCIANTAQIVDLSTDICNGLSVSMYMDGFQGLGNRQQQCLVFLFEEFKLDSAGKYFIASGFSVVIGMITELIVYYRRTVAGWKDSAKGKNSMKVMLYALQVTFGYIAMLIAMTYSLILFFMVILGLTIGHRLFNFKIVPTENADPCCPAPMEEKPESNSKTL